MHIGAQPARGNGDLRPQPAAADHRDRPRQGQLVAQRIGVIAGADRIGARAQRSRQGQAARRAPRRKDQRVIGKIAHRRLHGAGGAVDRSRAHAQNHVDPLVRRILGRQDGQGGKRHLAKGIGLGQFGAFIGRIGLIAQQGNLARKPQFPQLERRARTGLSCAKDDDVFHIQVPRIRTRAGTIDPKRGDGPTGSPPALM